MDKQSHKTVALCELTLFFFLLEWRKQKENGERKVGYFPEINYLQQMPSPHFPGAAPSIFSSSHHPKCSSPKYTNRYHKNVYTKEKKIKRKKRLISAPSRPEITIVSFHSFWYYRRSLLIFLSWNSFHCLHSNPKKCYNFFILWNFIFSPLFCFVHINSYPFRELSDSLVLEKVSNVFISCTQERFPLSKLFCTKKP